MVSDKPAHTLPPEAWTDARNMRFRERQAERMSGHVVALGTPVVPPGFIFNISTDVSSFWLYASATHVYVNDAGVHTQITRSAGAVPYTAVNARDWQATLLGGVPVLNNNADVPQYWPALSVGTDLANIPEWVTDIPTYRAKIIRAFGSFLVALNLTIGGVRVPHRILWSSRAQPGSLPATWDVGDATADAGQRDLTDADAGQILDALMLGNYLVIYKESATHLMSFIGGQEVMRFEFLLNSGLLATKCVCLFDKGRRHFVVTEDDIVYHSATKEATSVLDERVRDRLFEELDDANKGASFAFESVRTNECFFCYPTAGSVVPNRALVWNYNARNNTVTFRDWQGQSVDEGQVTDATENLWSTPEGTWADETGPWQAIGGKELVVADPVANAFWEFESGEVYGNMVVTTFLERVELSIVGKDRQGEPKVDYGVRKQVTRIWPKIRGEGADQVQVQLGVQEDFDDPVTYTVPKFYNTDLRYLDFEVTGRLTAVKLFSTANLYWSLEGYDMNVEVVGEN